jgi:S-adenosylmethionine:tRNA ribosyltransferase-isomerase
MRLSDFDYDLPEGLIAQVPAAQRTASRLLHLDGTSGAWRDREFTDLPQLVAPGDLMVFNDTRVIKARLAGRKKSGGSIEALVERVIGDGEAWAHVRASHAPREGAQLVIADTFDVRVMERRGDLFRLRFPPGVEVLDLLERHGAVPLPPYITHAPDASDEERYQTVFAREPGAVAAPTAGLHFDAAMIESLKARGARMAYVTLHVGAGTFQPVRVEDVAQHDMHSEWYHVPQATVEAIRETRGAGGRVIAVGTTSLRALETAGSGELTAGYGETKLFIVPGYRFRVVDRLVTNFHLPKSTLLMLVAAFAGLEHILAAYRHAVEARYRFFSYGDAMLIERQAGAA